MFILLEMTASKQQKWDKLWLRNRCVNHSEELFTPEAYEETRHCVYLSYFESLMILIKFPRIFLYYTQFYIFLNTFDKSHLWLPLHSPQAHFVSILPLCHRIIFNRFTKFNFTSNTITWISHTYFILHSFNGDFHFSHLNYSSLNVSQSMIGIYFLF